MNINATLFVESAIFMIFVALTMRYIWPHVLAVLQKREMVIRNGIENAHMAEKKLVDANHEADAIIKKAQSKRDDILKAAREDAAKAIEQANKHAVVERNRMLDEAHAQIDTHVQEIKASLVGKQLEHVQQLCRKVIGERFQAADLTQDILNNYLNDKDRQQ